MSMVHKGSFGPERRSAERFVVSLPVMTDRGPAVTRDVSVSGLYLVAEQPFTVGDHLELTMRIPDYDHPQNLPLHVRLTGSVVRVEEQEVGSVGAGVALDEEGGYLARAS